MINLLPSPLRSCCNESDVAGLCYSMGDCSWCCSSGSPGTRLCWRLVLRTPRDPWPNQAKFIRFPVLRAVLCKDGNTRERSLCLGCSLHPFPGWPHPWCGRGGGYAFNAYMCRRYYFPPTALNCFPTQPNILRLHDPRRAEYEKCGWSRANQIWYRKPVWSVCSVEE